MKAHRPAHVEIHENSFAVVDNSGYHLCEISLLLHQDEHATAYDLETAREIARVWSLHAELVAALELAQSFVHEHEVTIASCDEWGDREQDTAEKIDALLATVRP